MQYLLIEDCLNSIENEEKRASILCQDNGIWRCSEIICQSKEQLRFFNGLESCQREAANFNGGGYYLYIENAGGIYACTDYENNIEPDEKIEMVLESEEECLNEASRLNKENLNINWYACNFRENEGYICSGDMNDCPQDFLFPILENFENKEDCDSYIS